MDVIGELISIKIPSKSIWSVKYYCQIYFKNRDRHLITNVHQFKDSEKKNIHMHEHIIKWKEDIVHSCKLSIIEAASCSRLLTGTHALYIWQSIIPRYFYSYCYSMYFLFKVFSDFTFLFQNFIVIFIAIHDNLWGS